MVASAAGGDEGAGGSATGGPATGGLATGGFAEGDGVTPLSGSAARRGKRGA